MGFGTGLTIGLGIGMFGLVLCLFMVSSGKLNREEEAYQKGYSDGVNSVKKENE